MKKISKEKKKQQKLSDAQIVKKNVSADLFTLGKKKMFCYRSAEKNVWGDFFFTKSLKSVIFTNIPHSRGRHVKVRGQHAERPVSVV